MERIFSNLCNSCTNIGCEFQSGIVRTKCAFYMPLQLEPDNCGNYVIMQPTEEAIPKANVYKAVQELMKYEHEGFINISLVRLDEILKKCGVSEDGIVD